VRLDQVGDPGDRVRDHARLALGVWQDHPGDEGLAEHVVLKLQGTVDQPDHAQHDLREPRHPRELSSRSRPSLFTRGLRWWRA
jgi:hypothetical protein